MTQVELKQAKERFHELIELAASGEDVIIARDKRPFVKLSPILKQKRPRQFGSAKGLITITDDFDEPLMEVYKTS
ncbi:MAG: type II toxin-antitoxin system Phd/YefM family antitoxin [Anaerolineae bacterium]